MIMLENGTANSFTNATKRVILKDRLKMEEVI